MKGKNSEAVTHTLMYGFLLFIIMSFMPYMNYRHLLVAVLMFLFVYRGLSTNEDNPTKNLFNLGAIFLILGVIWYITMRAMGITGDSGATVSLITGIFYLILPKIFQVRYTKPSSTFEELVKNSNLLNKRDLMGFMETGDLTESGYYKITEILSLENELDTKVGNYQQAINVLNRELSKEVERQKRIFNKEEDDKEAEEDYVEQSVNESLINEIKDI